MKRDIVYFITQTKYNIKNAHALKTAFWVGVGGMMVNNVAFFVIWIFFMKATGPINGWTSIDVFGMLGVSLTCYGVAHSFFYGVRDLPELVTRGSFDNVLLSPVNSFLKLSGTSFSVTAYGDLLLGIVVSIGYGIFLNFTLFSWLIYFGAILVGCIVFISFLLISSLIAFFIYDGGIISAQVFEIFLRPSLYPGAIFPEKLKLFFMTVIPTLLTSAIPVDTVKDQSVYLLLVGSMITVIWVLLTMLLFKISVRRYESGNFLH